MNMLEKIARLPELPTVAEVSKATGLSEQNIRIGLQRGKYPFGVAIKGTGKVYMYRIVRERLLKWMGGNL